MAERALTNLMVTGGAGFIGSNFIRYLFEKTGFQGRVVNVDTLTYAGNPLSLQNLGVGDRYTLAKVDIRDADAIATLFSQYEIDTVVHFAAESHVDRSILGPADFVTTNINGTFNLLDVARAAWKDRSDALFHHVSTDEVFGSLGDTGAFSESTPYDPRSPYSASKAASDHLVRAYLHTFSLPVTLSNCSNNYGPYQFPEKLIPLMILNMIDGKALPVYGQGTNVRDWLYVEDHASAIWSIMNNAPLGRRTTGAAGTNGRTSNWYDISVLSSRRKPAPMSRPSWTRSSSSPIAPDTTIDTQSTAARSSASLGGRRRTTLSRDCEPQSAGTLTTLSGSKTCVAARTASGSTPTTAR